MTITGTEAAHVRGPFSKVARMTPSGRLVVAAVLAAAGSVAAKRALLIKAGEALSPDAFIQVQVNTILSVFFPRQSSCLSVGLSDCWCDSVCLTGYLSLRVPIFVY